MEDHEEICLKKNQSVVYRTDPGHDGIEKVELDSGELCLDPLKLAIARLADKEINRMRTMELAEVIKSSNVFASREWFKQLSLMEREDLVRLLFLARRNCQREINAAYHRSGQLIPFVAER